MNFQNNPNQPKKPSRPYKQPLNFVEALKSIGGHTVSSLKNDVIKGTSQDAWNSLIGQSGGNPDAPIYPQSPEWLPSQDHETEAIRRQRHREIIATPIYDRRQEEIKAQIESLRQELKALAKDIASLGTGIQKAIDEEIAHPGTYHLNFFHKLRTFLVLLRKRVSESRNWLALSLSRKAAKQVYWGNVKRSGTKYMLSSERTIATQTG